MNVISCCESCGHGIDQNGRAVKCDLNLEIDTTEYIADVLKWQQDNALNGGVELRKCPRYFPYMLPRLEK
jgi:hypothetical protein